MGTTYKIKGDIIFYDGYCVICSRFIRQLIKLDKNRKYSFASISSSLSEKFLSSKIDKEQVGKFIILYSGDKVYKKSDAVIKIFTGFGGGFVLFNLLRVFPKILRDFVYDVFASYRYRLFGKLKQCDIPSKEIVDRFIYD
ncbi:MAG: thiol-disulfide oxidoreductase [Flammeovirgaceae bacterium]|jgi:predicted DCC family thiol-disulfide oxidoreductase YuxK|nr:thiol-disulfide oxidoreductase [Flammeovirgaceae bacterium]|tara:strand:- start:75 stop:494 length:420 start_codon:yes stop_codon:yes gene_type:complete